MDTLAIHNTLVGILNCTTEPHHARAVRKKSNKRYISFRRNYFWFFFFIVIGYIQLLGREFLALSTLHLVKPLIVLLTIQDPEKGY